MEQRRLRLGDILDDYCPRERRVTNHAVVAMIEEDVKQTRCTTCDAEHVYKGGKAPRRRKKETPTALYDEVLAGMAESESSPALAAAPVPPERSEPLPAAAEEDEFVGDAHDALATAAPAPLESQPDSGPEREDQEIEEGPVHRPLIRATLPRPDGQKDARPLPEFTVRHASGRSNGNFRGDARPKHRGGQGGNGHRSQGGQRFAGARGQGRGPEGRPARGGGFRPQQPRHGGRKRSR